MSRQLAGLAAIFGALLLLLLLLMKRSADAKVDPAAEGEPGLLEALASTPTSPPAPASTPAPSLSRPLAPSRALAPAPSLALAPAAPPPAPILTPRQFKHALLENLDASLPDWQDCLADVNEPIPDGVVRVNFIAAHDETPDPVIETADVDHDASTIEHPGLRECLRRAALATRFESLPPDIPAIYVSYAVRVENGAIAGSEGREFSFLKPDFRESAR